VHGRDRGYEEGESWTCADGCNTCTCEHDGSISQTDLDCESMCSDETGTYEVGDSWVCPDGCNTCTCEEDGSVIMTDMDCG
jgi:hypothetical protein